MVKSFRFLVLLSLALPGSSGCVKQEAVSSEFATRSIESEQAGDQKAFLTLDEIVPSPQLATTQPISQPASRAPIEAIHLYAQAVDALQTGRRYTAVNALEKAIALDPQSFELHYALGRAQAIGRTQNEKSIAAFERAAELRPDHLELQTDLGRQYLANGDTDRAMHHLRLAIQTTQYKADEPGAGVADLFLGRALQQAGYDLAALEQYAKLLSRVKGRSISFHREPHLAFLITDRLYIDIGDLYARNGQLEDALSAFEPAARRDPSDFDLETRVIRTLTGLRRFDEASRRAADAVVRFRANKPSLDLLNEVRTAAGSKTDAADILVRLATERPDDSTLLFALVELLKGQGRWAQAEGMLAEYAARTPTEFSAIERWVQLRLEREDPEGAARLIIETLTARPELSDQFESLWSTVITPARPNHLRLTQLQNLVVLPHEAAAKELSIAVVADELNRNGIVDEAMQRGVAIQPPLAPLFRKRLIRIWTQRNLEPAERIRATDALIAAASADPVLAEELRGLSLMSRKEDKQATEAFAKALELGGKSPDLLLSYALALRSAGEAAKFEQLLWKLLSDHPSYENAYSNLYAHYSENGSDHQADRVLNTWLVAMPESVAVRLLNAARQFRAGRTELSLQTVNQLVDEASDNPDVLRTAYAVCSRTGKVDELRGALERQVVKQPGNVPAVSALIDLYEEKGTPVNAIPAINAARTALAKDPDWLYQVAHLYTRIGKPLIGEDVLAQVLALDPAHPPASNDLGYGWAERGENLVRAEMLIRQAIAAEPHSPSFLDSLGWVLYKRGNFREARPNLEKAAGDNPDPVVLDHLGDVLYRLGDHEAAGKRWSDAAAKLTDIAVEGSESLSQLKQSLDKKQQQLKSGETVTVSPVVEPATAEAQRLGP